MDDKLRIEEVDAMKDIYERKEKNRKGHNISVTTTNSTNSVLTATNKKGSTPYG
jgi:hypothetical protein